MIEGAIEVSYSSYWWHLFWGASYLYLCFLQKGESQKTILTEPFERRLAYRCMKCRGVFIAEVREDPKPVVKVVDPITGVVTEYDEAT